MFALVANQEANDERGRGLEWAIVRESGGRSDEDVEEDTERTETNEDAGNCSIEGEEVGGKRITKEEESGLEHQGQTFHDKVEMPCGDPIYLALSISTAVDDRSTHLDLGVTVEPLLSQHGDERGEEGGG